MVCFSYLDKHDFDIYASDIFNILADNMTVISPTGNLREEDYACWYEAVNDRLKNNARQIVLIFDNVAEKIVGFFQYYINGDLFMMEDIQLDSMYRGRHHVFRDLYAFVLSNIDSNLPFVEAYANKNNSKSIGILEKMGLKVIGLNKNGNSYHFLGDYQDLLKWFYKKRT
jgi:hypothetical protein